MHFFNSFLYVLFLLVVSGGRVHFSWRRKTIICAVHGAVRAMCDVVRKFEESRRLRNIFRNDIFTATAGTKSTTEQFKIGALCLFQAATLSSWLQRLTDLFVCDFELSIVQGKRLWNAVYDHYASWRARVVSWVSQDIFGTQFFPLPNFLEHLEVLTPNCQLWCRKFLCYWMCCWTLTDNWINI